MPNEPIRTEPGRSEPNKWEGMELAALNLLTDPCHQPTLWKLADIGCELEYDDPDAAVRPLINAGLLYRTGDGLLFATPAAFHVTSLVGHVI